MKTFTERPSGSGVDIESEENSIGWPYFESLLFLKENQIPRQTQSSIHVAQSITSDEFVDEVSDQEQSELTNAVSIISNDSTIFGEQFFENSSANIPSAISAPTCLSIPSSSSFRCSTPSSFSVSPHWSVPNMSSDQETSFQLSKSKAPPIKKKQARLDYFDSLDKSIEAELNMHCEQTKLIKTTIDSYEYVNRNLNQQQVFKVQRAIDNIYSNFVNDD